MCVILYHRQDREPSETMKKTDDQPTSESSFSRSQTHGNKKRKVNERTVVTVRIKENENKQQKKIEWPPADSWSWRKYGQKPIKGSPHPRGYYRCSTSKGCSAKKQVERCKTDASMLIVTYTSTHNHPGRDDRFSSATKKRRPKRFDNSAANRDDHYSPATTPKQESDQEENVVQETNDEHQFQRSPQSHPFVDSTMENFVAVNRDESNPFPGNQEKPCTFFRSEDSKPFYDDAAESSSPIKSDQDDEFYDELEELPTPLFLASFMRSSFGKERILVNPS